MTYKYTNFILKIIIYNQYNHNNKTRSKPKENIDPGLCFQTIRKLKENIDLKMTKDTPKPRVKTLSFENDQRYQNQDSRIRL